MTKFLLKSLLPIILILGGVYSEAVISCVSFTKGEGVEETASDLNQNLHTQISRIHRERGSGPKDAGPVADSVHLGTVGFELKSDLRHDFVIYNRTIYSLSLDGRLTATNLPPLSSLLSHPQVEIRNSHSIRPESVEVLGEPSEGQRITAFYVGPKGIWFVGESGGKYGIGFAKHKSLDVEYSQSIDIVGPVTGMKMIADSGVLLLATGLEGITRFDTQTKKQLGASKVSLSIPNKYWVGSEVVQLDVLNMSGPQDGRVQIHFYAPKLKKLGAVWVPLNQINAQEGLVIHVDRSLYTQRLETDAHSPTMGDRIFDGPKFLSLPRISDRQAALDHEHYSFLATHQFLHGGGLSVGYVRSADMGDLGYLLSHKTGQRVRFHVARSAYSARTRFDPLTGLVASTPSYEAGGLYGVYLSFVPELQ